MVHIQASNVTNKSLRYCHSSRLLYSINHSVITKTTTCFIFYICSPVNPVRSGSEHAPFFAPLPLLMMARLNSIVHLSLRHRHVILMLLASATVGVTQSWDHVCHWVAALVERVCSQELCSVSGVMEGLSQIGQFICRGFCYIQTKSVFAHCHQLILTTVNNRSCQTRMRILSFSCNCISLIPLAIHLVQT
jgi:hypothetical protein